MNKHLGVMFIALLLTSNHTLAWKVPVRHPSCPAYVQGISWKDYLSGKIPRLPGLVGNGAGVEFRTARNYNDPAAIGNLNTKACYTVSYVTNPAGSYPKKGYTTDRIFRVSPGRPDTIHGLPGDPEKYEVNVYGVILLFNDSGEIFDFKGRVVGVFTCTLRNECDGY